MDRPLGVVLVRRGIAEKDKDAIPEAAGDETAVATDDLQEAALKGDDRFVQIFEPDPVGSRRHADRFARHGGDLPTFSCTVLRDPSPFWGFRRLPQRDLGHGVPSPRRARPLGRSARIHSRRDWLPGWARREPPRAR